MDALDQLPVAKPIALLGAFAVLVGHAKWTAQDASQ